MSNTGNKWKKFVALFLCIMMMVCNTVYAETEDLTGSGQTATVEQEYFDGLTSDEEMHEEAGSSIPDSERQYDISVSEDIAEDESMEGNEKDIKDVAVSDTDAEGDSDFATDTEADDAFIAKIEEETAEPEETESAVVAADESLTEEVHQEAIQEDIVPEDLLEYEEMTGASTRSPISFPVTYQGKLCYDDAAKAIQILNKERKTVGVDAVQFDETYQKTAMERAKQASLVFEHTVPDGVNRNLLFGMVPTCKEIIVMGTQNESIESLCNNLFGAHPAEHVIEIGRQGAHREDALNQAYYAAGAGVYRAGTISVLVIHLGREPLSRQPNVVEKTTEQVSASYFGISMFNTNGYSPSFDTYPESDTYTVYGRTWTQITMPDVIYELDPSLYSLEIEQGGEQYFSIKQSGDKCIITPKKAGTGYIVARLKAAPDVVPKGGLNEMTQWNRVKVTVESRSLNDSTNTTIMFDNGKDYVYTGKAVRPDNIVVKYYNQNTKKTYTLKENVDYKVTKTSSAVGRGEVWIQGMGVYTGTMNSGSCSMKGESSRYYYIADPVNISLSPQLYSVSGNSSTYTGKAISPAMSISYLGNKMVEGKDYKYTSKPSVKNAGTYTFKIQGIGGFTGTKSLTYTVKPTSIAKASFQNGSAVYTGSEFAPSPTASFNGTQLKAGTDYTISPAKVKNVGTYTLTVTGKGNFTGKTTVSFTVTKKAENITPAAKMDLRDKELTLPDREYTGKPILPIIRISEDNTTLKEGRDYTIVSCTNNTNRGTAKVTIKGTGSYTGTVEKTFRIIARNLQKATVSTKYQTYDCTGNYRRPAVTVTCSGRTLTNDKDYTFRYENNKNVGTAKIIVTGKGNYRGTATGTFRIVKATETVPVYRLFNRKTGEHFYTASSSERQTYLNAGYWNAEGIAWYAPKKSSEPIYRLSNPNNGNEHHYTKSKVEKDWLVGLGWHYDCVAWYSDTNKSVPIYRHYHPIQRTGNHHYTTSKGESDHIVKYEGWNYEGISFYVSKAGG